MSLTVHKLVLSMLRRIGVNSYDPSENAQNQNRRGLVPGDLDEALIAANGAMEECFALGPTALSEQQQAGVLRASLGVTLDVTQHSTTVANFTTWASWMVGCTIRIPGDTRDNEIVSQTALLRPFMGTAAAGVGATVYGDCIPLASSVLTVMSPVEIPDQSPLFAANSREVFNAYTISGCVRGPLIGYSSQAKPIGQPGVWFGETRYNAANAFTQILLRVSPMPDRAYSLTYRVKVKPPTFTQDDLYTGTAYGTDPGTIIPFDWVESTLLPIAMQRFSAHPAFDNPSLVQELARQAEMAKRTFQESTKPMVARQRARYAWTV